METAVDTGIRGRHEPLHSFCPVISFSLPRKPDENAAMVPDRITPARAGGWTHAITVEDTSFDAAKRQRFQLFIAEYKA